MIASMKRLAAEMTGNKPRILMDLSDCPNDVLFEIFLRSSYLTVVRSSLVCRQWNSIIYNHRFWFQTLKKDKSLRHITLEQLSQIEIHYLQRTIAMKAFERNLINDNFFIEEPKFDIRWSDCHSNRRRAREWKVESPPKFLEPQRQGALALDQCDLPFESCMVSSYSECVRWISVNLCEYGLTVEFLNKYKPTIVITEYYTNRADCGCTYNIETLLRDSDKPDLMSDPDNRRIVAFEDTIDQWQDQFWRKAEIVYDNYPDGAHIVDIVTRGKDRQFWAGNYGSKVAGTSIIVKFDFNKNSNMN
ncbi:unnamed protein product [Bursaphelenchus okinawaensis]|uniref:F-box domain-containing protein n=1 Tax=Bursaphelenchus okinawaensis TaxID=465554 RepID=A0A811LHL2_9BILA|nr:unnamed protein product [Bursaphelenchus okinawaensis]CAG9125631.1 unnamed protein product [Bursaphelenchus okinawaensis]